MRDLELRERIDAVHVQFPTYGYRRLQKELKKQGHVVNHKKIRRIQQEYGLFAVQMRKFIKTTNSEHNYRIYPNQLREKLAITDFNEVWVADITYIRIARGFVYCAVILDLFSRKVVGWSLSTRIDRQLTLGALRMALERRKPDPGCIHHSDRGVQYACSDYIQLLKEWRMQISMSRQANPYDNAWAESFMKTLKYEEVYLTQYETFEDVIERVPLFIESVYNQKRIHSAIGYLSPNEFENKHRPQSL